VVTERQRDNTVHTTPAPKPADLFQVLAYARVTGTPVRSIMGDEMYDHWRRRVKRLDRAAIAAHTAGDTTRYNAIRRALRRLSTGSIQ